MIRFNIPYLTGKEIVYMNRVLENGHLAGDGEYSKACRKFFADRFGFANNYLTTSCTDALEMAAILANIQSGDEVIVPSYTFVSTANAFVLRGAKIIFCDSLDNHPNMNHDSIAELITPRTKVIVPVHYGGVACEMETITKLAKERELIVIEDAAQAIDSYYKGSPLGSIGDFGAFSFHETKNINCGEGGMLVVRDSKNTKRAEIIREKGTNRTAFFRGEVDKYSWVDIGSSFLASEIVAAFLFAQLEDLSVIQEKRKRVWNIYNNAFTGIDRWGYVTPYTPDYATNNGHVYYLLCPSLDKRTALMNYLNGLDIKAVFHYQPLHNSSYYRSKYNLVQELPNAIRFGDTLLRLPLYPGLEERDQEFIINSVLNFIRN